MVHLLISIILGTIVASLFSHLYTRTCNRIIEHTVLNNQHSPYEADHAFDKVNRANRAFAFLMPGVSLISFALMYFCTLPFF